MEYEKDFDGWNKRKKKIDNLHQYNDFYEREIWWISAGLNIGSEQNGSGELFLRPVLILRKISSTTFLGIPLTSRLKHDSDHFAFYFEYDFSVAIISQIRNYDSKRLVKYLGNISDYLHNKIKKATVAFILS